MPFPLERERLIGTVRVYTGLARLVTVLSVPPGESSIWAGNGEIGVQFRRNFAALAPPPTGIFIPNSDSL